MTNLNEFPTELLVIIFSFVNKKDRLNCKLVNKRWLTILMTHLRFIKDRHLYLTDCCFNKSTYPGSLLLDMCFPYQKLTLDRNIGSYDKSGDILWFCESVAPDVEEIRYLDYFDVRTWHVMNYFKNMKKIILVNTSIIQMIRSCMSFMERERKSVTFPNLYEIKEKHFQMDDNVKVAKTFLRIFPSVKRILSTGFVFTTFESYLNILTTDTFKLGISYDYRKNKNLEKFLHMPDVYVRKLKFIRGEIATETDLNFVDEMCGKYPTVQKITMWYHNVPQLHCYNKLTNLSIKVSTTTILDFHLLQQLQGLKKLTFYISSGISCLDWHNIVSHTGVKFFKILISDLNCRNCYENCLKSFPCVTEFTCYMSDTSVEYLKNNSIITPVQTLQNLKKLVIGSSIEHKRKYFYALNKEFSLNKSQVFHNLKYLHLDSICDARVEDLKNFVNIFPNLTSLSLDFLTLLAVDEVIKALQYTIKPLSHFNLQMKMTPKYDNHERLEKAVRIVIENAKHLRTLGLPSFRRVEKTCITNLLFRELCHLNFVSFGGDISYSRFYHL